MVRDKISAEYIVELDEGKNEPEVLRKSGRLKKKKKIENDEEQK